MNCETDNVQLEKKRQQIEEIREQKRKFAAQMQLLDLQEKGLQQSASAQDIEKMSTRFSRVGFAGGPVSEPTTPPEHGSGALPDPFSSRPARFSMNNVTSPPGLSNRLSQSNSHITSPPSGAYSNISTFNQGQKPPAKSMPGSRRNSEEEEYYPEDLPIKRSAVA